MLRNYCGWQRLPDQWRRKVPRFVQIWFWKGFLMRCRLLPRGTCPAIELGPTKNDVDHFVDHEQAGHYCKSLRFQYHHKPIRTKDYLKWDGATKGWQSTDVPIYVSSRRDSRRWTRCWEGKEQIWETVRNTLRGGRAQTQSPVRPSRRRPSCTTSLILQNR